MVNEIYKINNLVGEVLIGYLVFTNPAFWVAKGIFFYFINLLNFKLNLEFYIKLFMFLLILLNIIVNFIIVLFYDINLFK